MNNTDLWPLGDLSAEDFLRDYWQKKPLLIRNAIPGFASPVSGDELAGLACDENVESRLVIGKGQEWHMQHGPFDEDEFASLPPSHWTLLVQAVDHWVPEVRELLERFRFVPDWRLDDIMISYAAPGGGVGPHYDNYDVFLLQGQGKRRWQTGQLCDSQSPLMENECLRLLAEFGAEENWILNPGDMLYLPPCIAHLGEAVTTDCITISVGFRAPSEQDILFDFSQFAAQTTEEHQRYSDTGLTLQQNPGEITTAAVERVQNILRRFSDQPDLIARWLGEHMTQPKYPDQIPFTASETFQQVSAGSRLAWFRSSNGTLTLFANGESRQLPSHFCSTVEAICQTRRVSEAQKAELGRDIINWLMDCEALVASD